MNRTTLQSLQAVLLINWIGVPVLTILIIFRVGFLSGLLFAGAWLFLDKVWDIVTGFLIFCAGRLGGSAEESFEMQITGKVPGRMALMMMVDLLGTITLPWLLVGQFLGWH